MRSARPCGTADALLACLTAGGGGPGDGVAALTDREHADRPFVIRCDACADLRARLAVRGVATEVHQPLDGSTRCRGSRTCGPRGDRYPWPLAAGDRGGAAGSPGRRLLVGRALRDGPPTVDSRWPVVAWVLPSNALVVESRRPHREAHVAAARGRSRGPANSP